MTTTTLQRTDFSYLLPAELIAQTPIVPRDISRLLVLDRKTKKISHQNFRVLPELLHDGDILVRNNSAVIKARLFGHKIPTGGHIEILLNKEISASTDQNIWECIVRPGIAVGQKISFGDEKLLGECVGISGDGYARHILFRVKRHELFSLLETIGTIPLPPYITAQSDETTLRQQYQTTYAHNPGSVAAPTAGLHFTPEIDAQLRERGVTIAEVTLHVGLGTFLPVKSENIIDHTMHAEHFSISQETAEIITTAKREGRRIIAVGTTTCRVLESCAQIDETGAFLLRPQTGSTAIFIYPPHQFMCLDGLITNFHLPESTLLMLVSAFVSAPNTTHEFTTFLQSSVGHAYTAAIAEKYRFFSFGDAMLII
ncbi:tRNA preQ1(34) S-adenosylmethionine ribosyltransferase-isomerase QueA [Candidatus Woesebacteria bacterium]|nr:tRNA preQ1(34) S-adenosylmethionine ribosyltransferase-isomerase QueA [Candidatus Woesebacteria bacterium]